MLMMNSSREIELGTLGTSFVPPPSPPPAFPPPPSASVRFGWRPGDEEGRKETREEVG